MKIGARSAQDRRKSRGTTIRNDAFFDKDRQRSAEIGAKAQQSETTRFVRQCERK